MSKSLLLLVILSLTPVGYALAQGEAADLDADPHLVGWWKLDETTGTSVADSSKGGHKGTLAGGLSCEAGSVDGRIGKALKFDGKENLLEITGYKGVGGTQARSVAMWVKTTSTRGELMGWGEDDAGKMWHIRFIRGRVGATPSGGYYYMNDQISDDEWHHVVIVMIGGDPPNLHDSVNLYLDGEGAEVHDIGLLDLWPIETGKEIDVRIGQGFAGALDDVRIYDRALSTDEVKALYQKK